MRIGNSPLRTLALALLGCLCCSAGAETCPAQVGPSFPAGGSGSRPQAVTPARLPVYEPTGPRELVLDVRIAGRRNIAESRIRSQLQTRPDRNFDPEVVQADVRRLATTGLFRDIRTFTERVPPTGGSPGGVVVTFEVEERDTIRYLRILGNYGVSDRQLKKKITLAEGQAMNPYNVEEARRTIEEYYRTNGYPKADVLVEEGDQPGDAGVVLRVSEGGIQRILSVDFTGNTIATDARLRTQIKSKPGYLWYLFGGKVNRREIEEDVNRLTAYYRSLGFFDARIGRQLEYSQSGNWLSLHFIIDEGPRYEVRSVAVVGNSRFSNEQLIGNVKLQAGDTFNLSQMNADLNTLRDMYGALGYVAADVQADPRFLLEPGKLDLIYKVEEGSQYRVGKINVRIEGEVPHTRREVALNRISLRPGDILDMRELRRSERRLKASQLFATNPATGEGPEIRIRIPEASVAEGAPGTSGTYRGQSPEDSHAVDLEITLPADWDPGEDSEPPRALESRRHFQPAEYRLPAHGVAPTAPHPLPTAYSPTEAYRYPVTRNNP